MIACKKDDVFDPKVYEGEYPRNIDGSQITTYTPQIIGGDIQIKYNGHDWNHTPYIYSNIFSANLIDENNVSKSVIIVKLMAMTTNNKINDCILENLVISLPFEVGRSSLTKDFFSSYIKKISYATSNCDANKDDYALDFSKSNWFEIKSYNEVSKELQVEFDVNFIITKRNVDYGPVYPGHVNFKGTCKTILK